MQIIVFVLLASLASVSWAQDAQTLAKQKACLGCHDVERHTLAVPSYRKISEKYSERPDGKDYVKDRIRNGGKGVWGGQMPAFPTLTNQEIDTLADWIMGLTK